MRRFTAGTRGSALALWQTRHVTSRLEPTGAAVDERVIVTRGDTSLAARLQGTLEKGFFTAELEAALRTGDIDWAVHSLKDLPTRDPEGLTVGAMLERAPPGDLLVLHPDACDDGARGLPLAAGAAVGTSSLRREAMLRHFAPGCAPRPLRGNVPTRIEKLRRGDYDGVILAEAGVHRLGVDLSGLAVFRLDVRRWVCAPGQGTIGVQCRAGDGEVLPLLATIDHAPTRRATTAERELLRVLEGGCTTPFGAWADDARIHMGLLHEGAWRAASVSLPHESPDAPWLETTLEALRQSPPPELNDEPLAQRL